MTGICWKSQAKLPKNFWAKKIGFFFCGASFTHKTNKFDQARAPKSLFQRRPDQGLDLEFTAKEIIKGLKELLAILWPQYLMGKV